MSMLSLGCKALCIMVNFLVLLSIFPSSSFVQFKKSSEYLTMMAAQVFISLIRFLRQNLVSAIIILLGYTFINSFTYSFVL